MIAQRHSHKGKLGYVVFVSDEDIPYFASMWWPLWRVLNFADRSSTKEHRIPRPKEGR